MNKAAFKTHEAQTFDTYDREVAQLSAWLSENLGCTDIDLQQQRRWRPIFHAHAKQNDTPTAFFLKGDRKWPTHPYPLDYEMRMQRTMFENGIRVPEILGMVPEPTTIVMEWMDGGRDPGLIQEAIENRSVMTPDRWQATLRYMEILAELHSIAPEKFVAAGAVLPTNAQELALANFERFHAMSDDLGISDPFIAFISRWLRRNYPKNRSRVSFVTGDCGQFLADGRKVTCMMDVEIGHLGDNMHDLACFRGRHPIENMGDVPALFKHYEKAFGAPLDYDSIAFHTVSFLCEAYYGPLFGMHETGRGGDWVESLAQVVIIGRRCLEALAEIIGLELEVFGLPAPEETPYEDLAFNKLMADIARLPETEALQDWQRNILGAIPAYLKNRGHYRLWAEREDLAEVAALLGTPVTTISQADSALTHFITHAGPEHDAAITRLLHRRLLRQCLILAGPDAVPDHIALAKMEPILDQKHT
jgi:hypothetical protein